MLKCPQCKHYISDVKDTRPTNIFGGTIKRSRECELCAFRFTTLELSEKQIDALTRNDNLEKLEEIIKKFKARFEEWDTFKNQVKGGRKGAKKLRRARKV